MVSDIVSQEMQRKIKILHLSKLEVEQAEHQRACHVKQGQGSKQQKQQDVGFCHTKSSFSNHLLLWGEGVCKMTLYVTRPYKIQWLDTWFLIKISDKTTKHLLKKMLYNAIHLCNIISVQIISILIILFEMLQVFSKLKQRQLWLYFLCWKGPYKFSL